MERKSFNSAKPINQLSDYEQQKLIKFGKRGYEHCAHTMERICDVEKAIFDQERDLFFINHKARTDYIQELAFA